MPAVPTPKPPPWKPYDFPDDTVPVLGFTAQPWVAHSSDLATWVTKGTNCPACNILSGRTYPLAYWQATVMPGWHEHCDCRLVQAKSWVLESPHDLWGTEPYWWNPLESPGTYLSNLLARFLKYLDNRGKGDEHSGVDNLYPIFLSNNGFTTAGWTLLDYQIRIEGATAGGGLAVTSLFGGNDYIPRVCLPVQTFTATVAWTSTLGQEAIYVPIAKLPWETSEKALPNPRYYRNQ